MSRRRQWLIGAVVLTALFAVIAIVGLATANATTVVIGTPFLLAGIIAWIVFATAKR